MANLSSGVQVGWGSQWETLANAINDYYGGGVSSAQYQQVVNMLNSGGYTMEEMDAILGNIPEFERTYNANGELIRVAYKNSTNAITSSAGSIAQQVNSNVANSTATQFSTVQTVTKDAQTGKVTIGDSVTKYSSGTAGTAKVIATDAISAIAATAVGIKLGKNIDQALYNANPDFWDSIGMSSLNPETWASITAGENTLGATLFNFVLGIDPNTNNPQMYLNQDTMAYMTAYMGSMGAFNPNREEADYDDSDLPIENQSLVDLPFGILDAFSYTSTITGDVTTYSVNGDTKIVTYPMPNLNYLMLTAKNTSDSYTTQITGESPTTYTFENANSYTFNGETVYFRLFGLNNTMIPSPSITNTVSNVNKSASMSAWISQYGDISGGGGVIGIDDQEGATVFDPSAISNWSDISAVLAALLSQYPDLWDNRIEFSPDGSATQVFLPVGFPTGGVGYQPTTNGATQSDLSPDIEGQGDNATDELIKTIIEMIQTPSSTNGMDNTTNTPTIPVDPNGPGTGTGSTPVVIIPTGSSSALYSIYNPTQAEINNFGSWLWSSNFVDQLLKVFNDPMQAIIGLHKIFATPPISGRGNIKVGYLDSGVAANLVSNQYTEVDCGTVKLSEYFGNALDYMNTDVYIYLPFVGIVSLNVEDVTRANINVKYKVDVLTGACLASVNVTRDASSGGQLYVYSGNCAVQYPLSSGSYMGIVSGILGVAGSVAGTILSGGAMLPMALGAGAMAMNGMKSKVEHSGSLSGNAGAMGIKKPYLIIRRPQTKIAENFRVFNGESNNVYTLLSNCTGYTRTKYVHLENIPATDSELTQIEALLKSGILI